MYQILDWKSPVLLVLIYHPPPPSFIAQALWSCLALWSCESAKQTIKPLILHGKVWGLRPDIRWPREKSPEWSYNVGLSASFVLVAEQLHCFTRLLIGHSTTSRYRNGNICLVEGPAHLLGSIHNALRNHVTLHNPPCSNTTPQVKH